MVIDPHAPRRTHLLEVALVAAHLSMSPEQVRRIIRDRQIAAIRFGRRWRIAQADLDAYIEAHRIPADTPAPDRRHRDRRAALADAPGGAAA